MNYYERHLGDYAKDTAHLTMLEHGAYTLLLDRYYSTEAGIPQEQAHRVARARSKEEKVAVDVVLAEFFTLTDGIWTKRRVSEEITKAQARIKAAQGNGLKGGRPKKGVEITTVEPDGLSAGFNIVTDFKAHHTPDTNHQIPLKPGVTHTESLNSYDIGEITGQACVTPIQPGMAGSCCKAMIKQGVVGCNPHHPTLTVLLEAGATEDEFAHAARNAVQRGKANFAYVLGTVKRQREEAATLVLHQGHIPNKQETQAQAKKEATERARERVFGNQHLEVLVNEKTGL